MTVWQDFNVPVEASEEFKKLSGLVSPKLFYLAAEQP